MLLGAQQVAVASAWRGFTAQATPRARSRAERSGTTAAAAPTPQHRACAPRGTLAARARRPPRRAAGPARRRAAATAVPAVLQPPAPRAPQAAPVWAARHSRARATCWGTSAPRGRACRMWAQTSARRGTMGAPRTRLCRRAAARARARAASTVQRAASLRAARSALLGASAAAARHPPHCAAL